MPALWHGNGADEVARAEQTFLQSFLTISELDGSLDTFHDESPVRAKVSWAIQYHSRTERGVRYDVQKSGTTSPCPDPECTDFSIRRL